MPQEDYIMRQLRQFTQMLVQIVFKKQHQQYEDALEDIRQSGELFLGLDLHAVKTLTPALLQEALHARNVQDAEHTALIAELLHHQGDCFLYGGYADVAYNSYRLALHCYLDLVVSGQDVRLPDLTGPIDTILAHVDELALPEDTSLLLFKYLDARGRYGRAEDLLFHLADTHPTEALYAEGLAFFERLQRTSYRHLQAGNLPYAEVQEGLAAFQEKFHTPF